MEDIAKATIVIGGDLNIGLVRVEHGGEVLFDGGLTVKPGAYRSNNQGEGSRVELIIIPSGASVRFTGHVTCKEYDADQSDLILRK